MERLAKVSGGEHCFTSENIESKDDSNFSADFFIDSIYDEWIKHNFGFNDDLVLIYW